MWAGGNGWRTRPVPLGMGMVNLPQIATALKDIRFAGPIEVQAEYPNGGADSAQDYITLPREQVLGAMKRDLLTLRRGLAVYTLP
jgi:sugar phosphate isomerase/epimerase